LAPNRSAPEVEANGTAFHRLKLESSEDGERRKMRSPSLFFGRTTLDALYWLGEMPEENTKVFARRFQAAAGGPATNAAITHALLGGRTLLASAVGTGPWSGVVRAELMRLGIRLLDLADGTEYETPLCSVLVNGGDGSRTIVNPPISDIPMRRLRRWEQEANALSGEMPGVALTDGFYFDEGRELLTSVRDAGGAICLDGGSWKPGTDELAKLLTVAICSERFRVPGQRDGEGAEATMAWFAAKGVPHIAVTRGGDSIQGWDRGRRFEIEVARIEAVDTLGAGDVLHGAFCHFFAEGRDFEGALRRASEIATLSCRSLGTQGWAGAAGGWRG
jgi:sugar/nucleoside kinase (ribokinase family)